MFEILAYILAGCFLGIISGILPGIHINLLSIMLATYIPNADIKIVACIIAMGIVHSFVDFIPSICFGAPHEDNFINVLPGHRYFMEGQAYKAIMLTVIGGLFGIALGLLFLPIFFTIGTKFFYEIREFFGYILIATITLMIFSEKGNKKLWAVIIVLLSGFLGYIVLRSSAVENGLFAAITGLFGISTLLESITENIISRKQVMKEICIKKIDAIKSSLLSIFGGSIVALIPGLGPNQAAFLVRQLYGRMKTQNYLIMIGGINTVNLMFSFFALYSIGKGRSGPAVAIQNLIFLNKGQILLIIATVLIAASFGVFITIFIAKRILNKINKINYKKMNIAILFFVLFVIMAIAGGKGLLIAGTATGIGIVTIKTGIKRSLCMAFLILPIAIYYLAL